MDPKIRKHSMLSSFALVLGLSALTGCGNVAENASPEPTAAETEMVTPAETGTDSPPEVAPLAEPLKITVSILPQKYFVEKIGGDRVVVDVMVPEGSEPETYEPRPQQLQALQGTDAYILVGIFFEEIWAERLQAANSKMLMTDSSMQIDKITMVEHDHGHGEEGHQHSAGENGELLDPHTWLSPKRVLRHAQNIYKTLVDLDPEGEPLYKANLDAFTAEIQDLDGAIAEQLSTLESRTFLVFHPAWGYFAQDYELEQLSIEVGGQEPSAAELAELIQVAEEKNIRVIFAQYQFNSQPAQVIAEEIGAEVIYIDPLAEDWANNLLLITEKIVAANQN